MLSSMSRVDPEIDGWAKSVNEHNSTMKDGSPSGVTDGDAAGGDKDWKQIFKNMDKDLIEAREAFIQLLPENRKRMSGVRPDPGGTDGDAGGGPSLEQVNKVDVMEIYSPPRVTVQAKKYGLRSGEAMDLATGYDFNNPEDREQVWEALERDRPALVVGSPECRMFSGLQNLICWSPQKQKGLGRFRERPTITGSRIARVHNV